MAIQQVCVSVLFALMLATTALSNALEDMYPEAFKDTYLIDKSMVVMYFEDERPFVLTQFDLERSTIEGRILTPHQWISHWLTYYNTRRTFPQITIDEDKIDVTLAAVQKSSNLTLDQIKKLFKDAGYSYKEGRQQLGVMQVIKDRIDIELMSSRYKKVKQEEIIAYYTAHPVIVRGIYKLQRGSAPIIQGCSIEERKKELEQALRLNYWDAFIWTEPYELNEDEIAPESVLKTIAIGQVSPLTSVNNHFECVRLLNKTDTHQVPLEKREKEINFILSQEKMSKFLKEFDAKLLCEEFAGGSIKIIDPELERTISSLLNSTNT